MVLSILYRTLLVDVQLDLEVSGDLLVVLHHPLELLLIQSMLLPIQLEILQVFLQIFLSVLQIQVE
ncbi:MAG: hypothetical protein EBR82_63835 [Caulobacteraceae bacterium]|nr:hypothetical protein [Caulobacteraceae bacterium]